MIEHSQAVITRIFPANFFPFQNGNTVCQPGSPPFDDSLATQRPVYSQWHMIHDVIPASGLLLTGTQNPGPPCVRKICNTRETNLFNFSATDDGIYYIGETQRKIYVGNATVRSPGICEEHSLKHAIRTHHCESYVAKLDRLRNHGHTLFAHNIGVGLSRRSASSTLKTVIFHHLCQNPGHMEFNFFGPVFPQPRGGSKMVFQE